MKVNLLCAMGNKRSDQFAVTFMLEGKFGLEVAKLRVESVLKFESHDQSEECFKFECI